MKYITIRIEGAILSADILDKIEQGELGGQNPKDFGFDSRIKVKDEIAKAWADSQDMWRIFKRQQGRVKEDATGTTETRNYWIVPLLGLFGYETEYSKKAEFVNKISYDISHRAKNLDDFPILIMGFNDELDKKRKAGGPRISPHAIIQEYLNLTEHLYGIVTNGICLRLLRDSSRLSKLSFIEFDLATMIEEEHFADFAIMYRLLHSSRMPKKIDTGSESLIEKYHQDALDSGSRIREGLSDAVEKSIISIANGFLLYKDNTYLKKEIHSNRLKPEEYYQELLRLIYRILFLMVIEERHLIYPENTDKRKREIYYNYYSISHLRNLSEKRYLADKNFNDLWISLKNTFKLFEDEYFGKNLDIKPLNGELFNPRAIEHLKESNLDNKILLECLKNLNVFINKNTGQKIRVNYASLNTEEFGSVYEGLLEYDPVFTIQNGTVTFSFKKGEGRTITGSHYTPDELVQPLIKHSLDYIIKDKLQEDDPEKALLSIKVCDVAAGSGHILLNAARRIGTELACARSGEDQPSPSAFRHAIRDVIKNCIYGVDKNPLAVELCKVSLWLEAHNPGEPLSFLDHHIKCGDSIVGLANIEELGNGISTEAFKKLPGDDPEITRKFSTINKKEIRNRLTIEAFYKEKLKSNFNNIVDEINKFNQMPENTPEEIGNKNKQFQELEKADIFMNLKRLADMQVAQFFIPKTKENENKLITDGEYRKYLMSVDQRFYGQGIALAEAVAFERRFFHWFLEFPEIFAKGGFDCILGNPPYLGGQRLSGTYGHDYLEWLKFAFAPIGSVDLVTYFFRRIFTIIRENGFQSLIATNTIAQGSAREDGLAVIQQQGGTINYAIRSMRWPGLAAVEVAQVAVYKGKWNKELILDNKKVENITSYLDSSEELGDPYVLFQNMNKSFQGSIVLGKGFVLEPEEAKRLIEKNPKNKDVLFSYLNGDDLNSRFDQSPSRWVINFFDWEEEKCRKEYPDCFRIVEERVMPERFSQKDKGGKEKWWLHLRSRPELYRTISKLERVLVITRVSKYVVVTYVPSKHIFMDKIVVLAFDKAYYLTILQSNLFEHWAWKYSSTLGSNTINFSPSTCFETFPFPPNIILNKLNHIETIGQNYHEFRRSLMHKLQIGLTKTYNLFHDQNLTPLIVQKESKQDEKTSEEAFNDILKLRQLHKEMDEAVLKAYGLEDIDLAHNFYEVDYLPENDRIRYTISSEARKEVLKSLLNLNHKIHEQEVKAGLWDKKSKKSREKGSRQGELF